MITNLSDFASALYTVLPVRLLGELLPVRLVLAPAQTSLGGAW